MKTLKKIISIIFLFCITVVFLNCNETPTEVENNDYYYTEPTSRVRFIHSAASANYIDFAFIDLSSGNVSNIYSGATYGSQHGYYDFIADLRTFKIYLSGTSLAVSKVTFSLVKDEKYSIIVTDYDATINPTLLVISDTTATPDSGKAFLRFLHASADAPDFNIVVADTNSLVTNLSRYHASDYIELDAGTYDYSVVTSESGEKLPEVDPVTLISGVNYTVIFSGSINSLPGPVFNAKVYQETSIQ